MLSAPRAPGAGACCVASPGGLPHRVRIAGFPAGAEEAERVCYAQVDP